MSFMPEQFSLAARGAPGSKHDFPGSSPLLTGAVVLGSHHHGSPLLPLHDLGQHSPSNSSQSDTATDAQLSMGGGSAGAAAAAGGGGGAAAAAAAGADAASGPVSTNTNANTSSGTPAAAGKRAGSGRYQAQHIPSSVFPAGGFDAKREWLYRLVTFPHYFTPCVTCCSGSSTPKREQLMTLFDTRAPHRVFCCHCPTPKGSTGHFSASHGRDGALLQVRRSSFKNAVNANDICRFGADLGGVQQYTLNGNKIIYLAREQSAKKTGHGAPPPASCMVDGRAMMDKNSLYCSLMCKMQAEDPGFTNWLDSQDPSVRILAQVSANAPPVPTVACKRTYYASARDSSSSPKSSGSAGGMSKDSPAGSGASVGLPPLSMAVGLAGAGGGGVVNAGVFSSAVNRAFAPPQGGGGGGSVGGASSRPAKAPRLTARANSAPLAFTAGAGSSGLAGSSGNEALLLGMAASGRSSSGALLEGLTSRPVARQLLPHGPDAAAVEAAARQAAVAAAAAAFSGAGTSAAAAAARDALGAAGLAPIRTGNGSPVYSSISQAQRQQQQQQQRQQQQQPGAAAAAAEGQQQQQHSQQGKKAVSAFAVAAGASNAGGCKQLTGAQKSVKVKVNISKAASVPRPESPKAPGLSAATALGPLTTSISLPEPFLPGAEVPGSIPALPIGFEGVGGLLDTGFSGMGPPGAGSSAPWGSVGDIAGLLGVSDSHSPMHPMGLDGFDAFFGDGSLSPAPQMLF